MAIKEGYKRAAKRFGDLIRDQRKRLGKTQKWVADQVGVRRETIVQLEAGENVGVHIAAAAVAALGLELGVSEASAAAGSAAAPRLSEALNLSRTYDWSSPDISDDALIRNVLAGECFDDVLRLVLHYGLSRVSSLFEKAPSDNPIHRRIVGRMLSNIGIGLRHAAA